MCGCSIEMATPGTYFISCSEQVACSSQGIVI